MLLFDTTNEGGNGNDDDDIMNDFVIVPPKPDACYSYANLYDCYTESSSNQTRNGSCVRNSSSPLSYASIDVAATAATAPLSSASVQSPSVVSRSSSLLSSDSYGDEYFGNITGCNPPTPGANNNNIHIAKTTRTKSTSASVITRDPRNGAFTFQVHAEYDLLLHVKKDLFLLENCGDCIRLSEHIMHSIDEYCLKKQWMYHIGCEKGIAVSRFLRSRLERWYKENFTNRRSSASGSEEDKKVPKFICVDLGTYCGYSALVLAVTLHQFIRDVQHQPNQVADVGVSPPFEFYIYTTEISTKLLNVAHSIFRLAKMEDCITAILVKEDTANYENIKNNNTTNTSSDGDGPTSMDNDTIHVATKTNDLETNQDGIESSAEVLSRTLKQQYGVSKIDFLLLDHAKHMYLNDLQTLERCGLIGKGSYVSADNVVFNRLDTYREHMRQLELLGVVETRLEEMCLEYSNNLKDGIEMTAYLNDFPISSRNTPT